VRKYREIGGNQRLSEENILTTERQSAKSKGQRAKTNSKGQSARGKKQRAKSNILNFITLQNRRTNAQAAVVRPRQQQFIPNPKPKMDQIA